jgi:putative N-acetylmannosamine-6-phosphate epimerase
MQGVVVALAEAAQRGGTEGVASSALGAVVSAGAQVDVPAVQQPQTLATGVH